ncbi:MAG: rRNA pseudouridine synthase [Bacteroidales bacterium]|nr:rRNA pseudouridine synthase [Bacteroidales bacterium]
MIKSGKNIPNQNPEDLIRLNKFIASTGACSRREADKLIEAGKVKVNGRVITDLGTKVKPDAKVQVNNKLAEGEKKVYYLLNKPKDVITTTDDPEGRKTVTDLLGSSVRQRIYPVGRLDRNTTGILVLTNDGDLADKLTHPKYGVVKIYEIKLNKALSESAYTEMRSGIELEDGSFKMDKLSFIDPHDKTMLGVEIHSGRTRIIRRSFEHLGYVVVKLDRVSFAGLTKKNLPRGRYRKLAPKEVAWLKMKGKK